MYCCTAKGEGVLVHMVEKFVDDCGQLGFELQSVGLKGASGS